MRAFKVSTWNVEHMDRLFETGGSQVAQARRTRRLGNVVEEIRRMNPDILCLLEGPKGAQKIESFCDRDLAGDYVPVLAEAGEGYGILGNQWIWFIVKSSLARRCSLLPASTWSEFAGSSWKVHYWGRQEVVSHRHYRQPQTLVLDWEGQRLEFVGVHLKSKFVRNGRSRWNAGGAQRQAFVEEALKARIKLTTEAVNVRRYIDRRFEQTPNPGIFVLGDANDSVGKEYFENRYLFFDLLSNLQGDVFFARRFLNHALFDYDQHLRWTVEFENFVEPERDPRILIDHILFTQPLVDGSLPVRVNERAGFVEHEAHELVNAGEPAYARTSDHRPVSLWVDRTEAVAPLALGPAAPAAVAPPLARAPRAAEAAPAALPSCRTCVVRAVERWAGREVTSLNAKLSAIYADEGVCNAAALRTLERILRQECGWEIRLGTAWCGRKIIDLIDKCERS